MIDIEELRKLKLRLLQRILYPPWVMQEDGKLTEIPASPELIAELRKLDKLCGDAE